MKISFCELSIESIDNKTCRCYDSHAKKTWHGGANMNKEKILAHCCVFSGNQDK